MAVLQSKFNSIINDSSQIYTNQPSSVLLKLCTKYMTGTSAAVSLPCVLGEAESLVGCPRPKTDNRAFVVQVQSSWDMMLRTGIVVAVLEVLAKVYNHAFVAVDIDWDIPDAGIGR